jgi:gas vesicle protein
MQPEDRRGPGAPENFVWFALGAVLGVSAALLLAPEKGSHTRRRLAGQMKSGGQTLVDSGQDAIAKGRELFERGREIAQEAAEMFERGRRMAEAGFDEQLEAEHNLERGL